MNEWHPEPLMSLEAFLAIWFISLTIAYGFIKYREESDKHD